MDGAPFVREKHREFILKQDAEKGTFEYEMSEFLRISGMYWGISALEIMQNRDNDRDKELIDFVLSCQHEDGSFGGSVDHDGHLLYTLSAVQVLAILDALDRIDADRVAHYVASLQQPDGSFAGDKWGEIDTRFSYCALLCLTILDRKNFIDVPACVEFVIKCHNFDGGFGCVPGAESHGGQIFCCVGALALTSQLSRIDPDRLGWWLAERQTSGGGLNGRPEKLPDVCYSWWVLSSLAMIGRVHWIDRDALVRYILACQDQDDGGIADRPGDMADIFHTFFGCAGLSLLGYEGMARIDPVLALPVEVVQRLGIPRMYPEITWKGCMPGQEQ